MKWAFDYENLKMIYADSGGYDWSGNRLMEAGTYDEDDLADDSPLSHEQEHDHELLESDEAQAMDRGWFQNENYNTTYGTYDEEAQSNEQGEEQSWLNSHTNYDEDNDGVIDDWSMI